MPQIAKQGKFIFGWSLIRDDFTVQIPAQTVEEYDITSEGKVFIISGSKKTGGFSVSKKSLMESSVFKNVFSSHPLLYEYKTPEGELISYKGRYYTWLNIDISGKIRLTESLAKNLLLEKGNKLLSIRSSNIAFTMGLTGPIIKGANEFEGEIKEY